MDNGHYNQQTNGPKKQSSPLSMIHQVKMEKESNRFQV